MKNALQLKETKINRQENSPERKRDNSLTNDGSFGKSDLEKTEV